MKPLDSLAKRDLLAKSNFDPEEIRGYAEEYLSQERLPEAFDFYRKLGDKTGIEKVRRAAIDTANPDILWRIESASKDMIGRDDWIQCGEKAMSAGKFHSAAYAFQHAGDADRQAAAEREFMPAQAPAEAQKTPPQA